MENIFFVVASISFIIWILCLLFSSILHNVKDLPDEITLSRIRYFYDKLEDLNQNGYFGPYRASLISFVASLKYVERNRTSEISDIDFKKLFPYSQDRISRQGYKVLLSALRYLKIPHSPSKRFQGVRSSKREIQLRVSQKIGFSRKNKIVILTFLCLANAITITTFLFVVFGNTNSIFLFVGTLSAVFDITLSLVSLVFSHF